MSMLTPAGDRSGPGGFAIAVRRTLAVLVVLALLGGAAFASWWYLVRDEPPSTAAACPPAATPTPTPAGQPKAKQQPKKAGKAASRPARSAAGPRATQPAARPEAARPRFLPGRPAPARQVTVTVLNATDRSGLAARVTGQLRERGFRVRPPANDPSGRSISAPAEVRFGRAGANAALRVAAQVAGAEPRVDGRSGAGVDLVLGDGFRGLRSPQQAKAAARPVTAAPRREPTPAC